MTDEELSLKFARHGEWRPIPRLARVIPFGYKEDPTDPNILQPVLLELEALVLAKKHLKLYSSRQVAEWVSNVTGRTLSHVGLLKRLRIERSRRNKIHSLKNWAKRRETTQKKIECFEARSFGPTTKS